MNQAIEAAEKLRQQAIATLLDERGQIDDALKGLGWQEGGEPTNGKRRGRPVPRQRRESKSKVC